MRVLVTGNLGYIGTVLTPMMQSAGFDVVGLDSDLYAACNFGAPPQPVETMFRDIRDVERADLQGFDAVVHLAGLSNDPLGDLNPALTFEINYHASVRLARLAKEAGVERFVFSSSCSVYGAAGEALLDEDAAFNPVTPYGRSNVLAEQELSLLADENFSPIFLRNATAYGFSPFLRFDLVLNNLVAWALTTGRIFLKSDGTPWRPLVHVEDIARAFIAALRARRSQIHNRAFNVGRTSENYRIRDLARIVADAVPGCRMETAADAEPDQRTYRVSCDKITRELPSFRPTWKAIQGAQQLYEAYRRIGLAADEFEGPRYKRVAHIQVLLASGRLDETLRWKATL